MANIAPLPQLRGTSRLHTCEQCRDLHGSTANLGGFPVLLCPSVSPPGAMYLKTRQIIVGAEPVPDPDPQPTTRRRA